MAAEGSFILAFGMIVAVRVLTRLAFRTSDFLDEWLDVPRFRGGRLEIYRDRIRRRRAEVVSAKFGLEAQKCPARRTC